VYYSVCFIEVFIIEEICLETNTQQSQYVFVSHCQIAGKHMLGNNINILITNKLH